MKSNVCPVCGVVLEQAIPLAAHQGDALCQFVQARRTDVSGHVPAGNVWQTLEASSVQLVLIPVNVQDTGTGTHASYRRFAPDWAVWIAECTAISAPERRNVLAHCLANPAAQRAASAAFRVGGMRVLRAPAKAEHPRFTHARATLQQFFADLVQVTGS